MKTQIPVECLECGDRFFTASMEPRCPKCHGYDVEPRLLVAPYRVSRSGDLMEVAA